MKKFILLGVCLCVVTSGVYTYGGIVGSSHDFSSQGWSNGKACEPCHISHNADTSLTNAPLWNHETTTADFTLYSTVTLDATVEQPKHSKLCLSCHDGTIGIDSFGGNSGYNFITGSSLIGIHLNNMHPIGFIYNADLATTDGGLYDPETAPSGQGATITEDMLNSGYMGCSSCHDVHNTTGVNKLLRIDNTESLLCLTCHNK